MSSESSSKSGNYIHVVNKFSPESAELSNGRWAMIGITSLIGAYATTGQIIPGFFYITFNLIHC
ncbi:hypothetical protein [Prochlorococcus sp. MIT 0801]|uniref:hypothetical protein n=1 Tax=Prochlorococcus sp. MIT 0801 TaxID=1501269 RepID=UPI0004F6F4B4|nr:hypothetical protein [Prochlorococcus sp. MIT 0801]AIQ97951.1 hypothetical protein EW15_1859 [Prochlorococcus sp. MIT 0801]